MKRCVIALTLLIGTLAAMPPYAAQRAHLAARWAAANHRSVTELDSGPAAATPPPNLRALARRELAVPGRYRLTISNAAPPQTIPWWLPAWRWLSARWADFLRALFGRVHVSRGGALAIGDGLIAVVALLTIFVIVRLLLGIQRERRARSERGEPLAARPSARERYERACLLADRGDYGAALRSLFAATIVALEVQFAAGEGESTTIGEIRRSLRGRNPSLVAPFDTVASAFATVAYAERPADARVWERARDAYRSVESGVLA